MRSQGTSFGEADGETIWYDHQLTRGQNFYLASYNTKTKARHWYSVDRDDWSIHYAITPDFTLAAGDGADGGQVSRTKNARWIELFHPVENPVPTEIDQTNLIQSGRLTSEHLVSMQTQNYTAAEPNVRFSPDHKLVLFTGNMTGPSYVYAVAVAKEPVPAKAGQ